MRREKFAAPWRASYNSSNLPGISNIFNTMSRSFDDDALIEDQSAENEMAEKGAVGTPASISHRRAHELIDEQTRRLLPPQEANELAEHLLTCDRCFRYAQDIAHQERQSGKHSVVRGSESTAG